MNDSEFNQQLRTFGVIPIIAIDKPEHALPLADALAAGGLPIIEITFRTAAAAQVIQILARERPKLLLGAGTVLTREHLQAAKAAGAQFAVAPGLNPEIVKHAQEQGLPFIPGVATPSEIERALGLRCTTLKLFPIGPLGGVEMVGALSGPFAHTGVRWIPTGGVNPSNLEAYIRCPAVIAAGGTWLAKKEDLAAARWEQICQRCRDAVRLVAEVRGSSQ